MTNGTLVDLAWELGVIAASVDSSQSGTTFVKIKWTVRDEKDLQLRNIFMEVTVPQFYEILHELEKAQNSLSIMENK